MWVKCNLKGIKLCYLNTANYSVIFQQENLSSQTSIFPGSRLLSTSLVIVKETKLNWQLKFWLLCLSMGLYGICCFRDLLTFQVQHWNYNGCTRILQVSLFNGSQLIRLFTDHTGWMTDSINDWQTDTVFKSMF